MSTAINRGKLCYRRAVAIVPGSAVAPGHGVAIDCSVAGIQNIKLSGGDVLPCRVGVGLTVLDDFEVIDAPSAGTTATATVYNLAC